MSDNCEIDLDLLMFGYVRDTEKKLKLSMNVPNGIIRIMHELYPVLLFKFGDFQKGKFVTNDERTILKGCGVDCDGHLVYADLGQYNNIGLNKGIHLWSIKILAYIRCYFSIGVTTEKNNDIIGSIACGWLTLHDEHWPPIGHYSYCDILCSKQREINTVWTMKIDCNDWKVTYYRDGEQVKQQEIECDKFYFPAIVCCDNYTHCECIETHYNF